MIALVPGRRATSAQACFFNFNRSHKALTSRIFLSLLFLGLFSFHAQAQLRLRQASNSGGGHWVTFDGIRYNHYDLGVQVFADNGKTGDEAFKAHMFKVKSSPNDRIVWSKDFAFKIGRDHVLITQETLSGNIDGTRIFINGEEKTYGPGLQYDLPNRPVINGAEAVRQITIHNSQLLTMTLDMNNNNTDGNNYTETLTIRIDFFLQATQPFGNIRLFTNVMGTDYGPLGSNNGNQADDVCDFTCLQTEVSIPLTASLFADPPSTADILQDITLDLDENGRASMTTDAVGGEDLDDSGNPLSYDYSQVDFGCSNIGTPTETTVTMTNAAGVSATALVNVNVADNLGPTLVTNHVVIQLDSEGNGSYTTEELFSSESRDNCGGAITFQGGDVTVSRDDVANSPYEIVVKGTDQSGNVTRTQATITVLDYVGDITPPVASAQDITVELDENGNASITPEQIDNGSTDDSGGALTYALSQTEFDCNSLSASCSGSSIAFNGTGIASDANGENIQNLGQDQLTMEAWVKQNGGAVNSIIRKAGDYDLYIVNNILYAEVWYEGRASSAQYLFTGPTVADNAWSHVAFAFDKANNGSGKFYVNGVETLVSGTTRAIAPDITLGIGGSTEYGQSFTGLIDDVRIWSVERTSAEVNEFKGFCIDANSVGLEAYYKIEANEGTTLTDYSGNGNHLTITGATWSFEGAPIESKGVEITLTVTDDSNNSSSATANVIVHDNIAPTLVGLPADVKVEFDAVPAAANVIGNDNCVTPTVTFLEERTDGISNNNYTLTRTWTATDASGNAVSETQVVTVEDATQPTVITKDITVELDESGNASIAASDIDNGSNDGSGNVTLSIDRTDFNCNDLNSSSPCGGTAIDFNSTNNYIDASDNAWFPNDQVDDYTYEAWINMDDVSTLQGVVDYAWTINDNEPHSGIWVSDGQLIARGRSDNGASGYFVNMTGGNVIPNQWHHVAFTKSGSTYSLYLDGALVNSQTVTIDPSWTFTGRSKLLIGSLWNVRNVQGPIDGRLDEVRIWSTAKTIEELNAGKDACVDPNQTGLEHYYKMNEGSGAVVFDATPRNNTGSFVNLSGNGNWVQGAPVSVKGSIVTLTVSDASGNEANGTAKVTVLDNMAPLITAPADISVIATSAAGAIVNYVTPVGTDNCTVSTVLTEGFANGATFPMGTTVVTYTATDGSGNAASASFNVNVTGIAPDIVVPANITVSTDGGACGAIVNFAATETAGTPASTIEYNVLPGTFFPVGTTTVTATATNPVGTSSESFTVTVVDDEAPIIPVSSGNSSVSLPWGNSNGWSPWVHNFNLPIPEGAIVTGVDMNFDAVDQGWGGTGAYATFEIQGQTIGNAQLFHSQQNYNINYSGSIDGYVNSGNNQLKMYFQGYSGWVAYFRGGSMTISYTVEGTRAKDLTVYLDASGNASVLPSQIDPGVTDNCEISSITIDQSSFNCSNIGANEVNLIAVDINGNESIFASSITVIDNIAPTIITQDVNVNLDASGTASITAQDVLVSGSDNCGPVTYALSQSTFGTQDVINSPVTIQLTATDPNGNVTSAEVAVTVIDPVPVVLTKDITVSLDANGNATITPEQIDNGSSSLVGLSGLALDIASFDCSNVGTPVIVALTATSTLGSTATGKATVTVVDDTAPEFLTRESFIIYLDASGVATVTPDQFNRDTVADNCGVETLTFDKTTFNCDERGFHVINVTATDTNGNATIAQADVEVRDEIAPTVITKNITVDLDATGNATISPSDVDNGTFDNCAFTLSLNMDSFTCAQIGDNVVELTAQDQNGVFASANATVTVRDVTAPEFLTRESFIIYLDASGVATVTPDQFNRDTVADNCAVETLTFDKTTFNCDERGFHVINVTATDASGNSTITQADVEVRDEIAPTVITKNIIVDLDAIGYATISPSDVDNGTFDNCAFTLSLNIDSFTCAQVGDNVVELTAQDQNGVFASANAIVTVRDVTAPTVITKDVEVALGADGTYTLTAADIDNGTYDNCTYDLSVTNNIFDCNSLGEQTVTLTATDANGNTSTATATVMVVDNAGPVIVTKDINAYLDENGNATITLEDVNEGVTDGCGVTSTTIDITSFDCSNLGANTVTVTAVDVHGNTSTATATVTVIDNIAPTVFTKNITVNLDASGNATIRPVDVLLQEETTELCTVSNAGRYGMVLYQYVKRYRSRPASRATSFVFTATGRAFRKNPDGTATIYGTLTDRLDAQDSWLVRLKLKNASNWEEWSAQGNRYTGSRNLIGDRYLDWTYYELDTDSKLIGAGRNTGETISLGSRGGFQVGEAASGRNRNFGIGGHFRYTTRRGRRSSGVFNFDLNNCSSYTKEQDGPITDDNCGIASTSLDISSFDCSNVGDNIVNVTVKDASGNATTMPATVTVKDVTNPYVRAVYRYEAYLGPDGTVTIDPKQLDRGSRDNCEIVSYSLSRDTFTCRDLYYSRWGQNVTYTVTDAAGNSSSTVVNVVVYDIQAPVISTEPITVVVTGRRSVQVSKREIASRITDNCGVASFYNQRKSFTRADAGLGFLWVVATDWGGQRTFGYVRVQVIDLTNAPRRVEVCIEGKTRLVSKYAVQRYLSRGAKLGACDTDLAMTTGGVNLNEAMEREVTFEPLIELGAYPNPAQDQTTIKFSSEVAGPATVGVISSNGVRLNTLFDGEMAANENVEVSYNTSNLPNGVYIVRLVTAGEIRNLKLIVRK